MRITSIIFHNENVKLKLQRFLRFEELPDRFKTSERASNINTRWLLEDKPIIVDLRVLVNKRQYGCVTNKNHLIIHMKLTKFYTVMKIHGKLETYVTGLGTHPNTILFLKIQVIYRFGNYL